MALSLEEVEARALARWQPAKPTYDAEVMPSWYHVGQGQVWEAEDKYIVPLAGTQGGKSAIIPDFLLRDIQRATPMIKEMGFGVALLIGPTLTLMAGQTIVACERRWDSELQLGRWTHGNRPQFTFSPEGCRELLGFETDLRVICGYGSSPNNIESVTACAAAWDEAGQNDNSELAFEALERRLLIAQSKGFGRCVFPTTPYEWGWFKRRLVDSGNAKVISWPSWYSPVLKEEECRLRLAQGMPEWRWRMMYEGTYTRPAGQIYDCFDANNIVADHPVPDDAEVYAGIDFGERHMCAVFAYVAPNDNEQFGINAGDLVVFRTYLEGSRTVRNHVVEMKNKALCFPRAAWGGAPSEDGWREDFGAAGFPIEKPPVKDVEVGISRVYRGFATNKLKIMRNKGHALIEEVERYTREIDPLTGEVSDKISDKAKFHRSDGLRYMMTGLMPAGSGKIQTIGRFR